MVPVDAVHTACTRMSDARTDTKTRTVVALEHRGFGEAGDEGRTRAQQTLGHLRRPHALSAYERARQVLHERDVWPHSTRRMANDANECGDVSDFLAFGVHATSTSLHVDGCCNFSVVSCKLRPVARRSERSICVCLRLSYSFMQVLCRLTRNRLHAAQQAIRGRRTHRTQNRQTQSFSLSSDFAGHLRLTVSAASRAARSSEKRLF